MKDDKAAMLHDLYQGMLKDIEEINKLLDEKPPMQRFKLPASEMGRLNWFSGKVLVDSYNRETGMVNGRLAPMKKLTLAIKRALREGL